MDSAKYTLQRRSTKHQLTVTQEEINFDKSIERNNFIKYMVYAHFMLYVCMSIKELMCANIC